MNLYFVFSFILFMVRNFHRIGLNSHTFPLARIHFRNHLTIRRTKCNPHAVDMIHDIPMSLDTSLVASRIMHNTYYIIYYITYVILHISHCNNNSSTQQLNNSTTTSHPIQQNDLDDFLRGLQYAFPNGQTFGGIASTVSSLSRARLFCHSSHDDNGNENNLASSSSSPAPPSVYGDGCVGVALRGDIRVDTMIAQGAKPVGGVYRVVAVGRNEPGSRGTKANSNSNNPDDVDVDDGSRSTIGAIVLDEAATAEEELGYTDDDLSAASGNDDDDDDNDEADAKAAKRAQLAADYAKARIPKPPLAEANFLMRRLSDDDQAFMRRALLIGLERGGSIGKTPNELMRLAKGEGHRFTVRQVASAGMKDGSVTFPLGSVNVEVGARCRFFVRDGEFAKKEVEALWTGYKKRELTDTLNGKEVSPVTGCMVFPTLDRGSKLFGGKAGYESGVISTFLPGVPSISGFYANGVLGKLDGTVGGVPVGPNENMLHGSASCYVMFRSSTLCYFASMFVACIPSAVMATYLQLNLSTPFHFTRDEASLLLSQTSHDRCRRRCRS